eukprot:31896_1
MRTGRAATFSVSLMGAIWLSSEPGRVAAKRAQVRVSPSSSVAVLRELNAEFLLIMALVRMLDQPPAAIGARLEISGHSSATKAYRISSETAVMGSIIPWMNSGLAPNQVASHLFSKKI